MQSTARWWHCRDVRRVPTCAPSGSRCLSRAFFLLLVVVANGIAGTSRGDEWPAWRGPHGDGRIESTRTPTSWSASKNIRWKTRLPGSGFSSPIVAGARVYVTTAYVTSVGSWLHAAGAWATYAFAVAVVIAGTARVAFRQAGESSLRHIAADCLFVTVLLVPLAALLLGEGAFDFQRCGIRAWIVTSTVFAVCIGLAAVDQPAARRRAFGIAAIAFAAFVLVAFPEKAHAMRGGLLSRNSAVVFTLGAFPLAIGLFFAARPPVSAAFRIHRGVLAAAATVLVSAALIALSHFLYEGDFFKVQMEGVVLSPFVPWSAVIGAATFFVLSLVFFSVRRSARSARLLLIASAVSLTLIGGLKLLELVVSKSLYLIYHVGHPRIVAPLGTGSLACLAVVAVVVATLSPRPFFRKAGLRAAACLPALVISLGAVGFVVNNYFSKQMEYVRAIICLDQETGEILWTCEGLAGKAGQIDRHNSPATPTPVCDDKCVYAYFGTAGLMCADRNGTLLWSNRDVPYSSAFGAATSPVLSGESVIVVCDMPGDNPFVRAVDRNTGEVRWSHALPPHKHMSGNSRTPIVRPVEGRQAVLVWNADSLRALDVSSGEELWVEPFDHVFSDMVASVVCDEHRGYLSERTMTRAIDLANHRGGESAICWKAPGATGNVSSPVLVNGLLFAVTDAGIVSCIDAASGRRLKRLRLDGQFFAPLVANGRHLYVTNTNGKTTVLTCDSRLDKISENELGEEIYAGFAAAADSLYVRTVAGLLRLEE